MLHLSFTPFPILVTERLILRSLEMSDAETIYAHRNDDAVNTWLDGFRHASIEDTKAFIQRVQNEVTINKTILWVLTRKDCNDFMGTICFWNINKEEHKAETGYSIRTEFQGKGYMHEAMIKMLDFGFNTMKLQSVEAFTHKENKRSISLLTRNGFRQDESKEFPNNRIMFNLHQQALSAS